MKTIRKQVFFAAIAALVIILTYCVPSVHPFYTKQDVIKPGTLQGFWKSESGENWIFFDENEGSHLFLDLEPADFFTNNLNKSVFYAELFQLENYRFIDLFPVKQALENSTGLYKNQLYATHSLARIDQRNDSLLISFQNPDYLAQVLKERRIRIKHERRGDEFLLTAPTTDLQKFVLKYIEEEEAYIKGPEMTRQENVPDSILKAFGLEEEKYRKENTFINIQLNDDTKPFKVDIKRIASENKYIPYFVFHPVKDTLNISWKANTEKEGPGRVIGFEVTGDSLHGALFKIIADLKENKLDLPVLNIWKKIPENKRSAEDGYSLVPKVVNKDGDTLRLKAFKIDFKFDYEKTD